MGSCPENNLVLVVSSTPAFKLHEVRGKKTVGVKPSPRWAVATWERKQRESGAFYSSCWPLGREP